MKNIVLLGSTGSIGTQALQVIERQPEQYKCIAISAEKSAEALLFQAVRHRPLYVGIADETAAATLRGRLPEGTKLLTGQNANADLAALPEADIILIGVAGFAGLPALLAALRAGKTVALANKESIVFGNRLVQEALKIYGGSILPVDSEHSAIFQCLQNGGKEEVTALHLTASGGPFYGLTSEELKNVTVEQALKHPVWRMGSKISIDSATLMNKGLEVIEASYLFDIQQSNIFVLIHPQSIIHSMVEYCDGTVIAQLSAPDMRLAIQYALSYPQREKRQIERLSLSSLQQLTFFCADEKPAIRLARQALIGGDAMTIAYCAANDVAVELFLNGRIGFMEIIRIVEHTMEGTKAASMHTIEEVLDTVAQARRLALSYSSFRSERKTQFYGNSD